MPKRFEPCPKCDKKGFYEERGWSMNPSGTMRCRYCYYTQLPGQTYASEPAITEETPVSQYYDALDEALDTFQWAYQDRAHNRGEISLDRETGDLVLHIFVADSTDESYDPQETSLVPLEGRYPVDTYKDPQAMIREAVHAYVCHEADEQMWFDNERVFDPHKINA